MASSGGSPRILAIVCSWHPLTAADNAGADGLSYGTSTTVVPVDCAGTVSAASILRAFTRRADGVLVAACGRGDCHYVNGNDSCESVVEEARELMRLAGLESERLRFDLSSDVAGARFVELIDGFAAEVARLGRPATKRKARPAGKKSATKRKAKPAGKKAATKSKARPAGKKKATKHKARPAGKKAATKRKARPAGKKRATKHRAKPAGKKSATKRKAKPAGKTAGKTAARRGRNR